MTKRILAILLLFCLLAGLASCQKNRVKYEELGIPMSADYQKGDRALCVWDLAIFNGKIYIGGGDYDENAGPVNIYAYDISAGEFTLCGSVPDEEVTRFYETEGKLLIPGTDPKEDWSLGNYYVLDENGLEVKRCLANGVHNFDMISFEGKLFAGLGTEPENSPILCSNDGGETFFEVALLKEGKPVDSSDCEDLRVYDFFLCNGELYAALLSSGESLRYEIYRYEGNSFAYFDNWMGKIRQQKYVNNIVGAKLTVNEKLYFSTGYLYAANDMKEPKLIAFPEGVQVHDLLLTETGIQVLCAEKMEKGWRISVWESPLNGEDVFEEIFHFKYEAPAICFCKNGNDYYFGIGDRSCANEKNGAILKVKYGK